MGAASRIHHRVPEAALDGLSRLLEPGVGVLQRADRAGAGAHRALVALGLLLPLAVLYRQQLFAGAGWLDTDFLVLHQPRYALLADGLAEGRIPLWIENLLGGFPTPFSEFGWFYPLTWALAWLLGPLRGYIVEVALGVTLAAAAAYWLGRVWGLSRLAAFLAAFLFAYGPFFFATSKIVNYVDIFFALPAGIAAIELIARGRRRYAALLAATAGVMAIAGHPQIAFLFGFVWAVFGLVRAVWEWRSGSRRPALGLVAWLLASACVGVGLAAVRLLPTIAVAADSTRGGGLDFSAAAQDSLAPWSLVLGYLFPAFEIPRVLGDTLNAEELMYLGILTPVLALLAVLFNRRSRLVQFLAVLVVFSWIIALGSYSLGFPLLHKLPLFNLFRAPSRFGMIASFGLAFLVGMGLDTLRGADLRGSLAFRWISRGWIWLAGLMAAAAIACTIAISGFAFLIRPYGYDYIDRVIVGSEGRFLTAERYYRTFDQLYARLESAFSLVEWAPRLTVIAALLSALVIWRYARGRLGVRPAQWAFAAVLVGDVLVAPGHAAHTVPTDWHAREPQLSSLVGDGGAGRWRVFSYRGLAQKFELSTATGTRLARPQRDLLEYVFLNQSLSPNLSLSHDLASLDGYENLMPRATAEYLAYVGSERATVAGFARDSSLDAAERQSILAARVHALAAANVRYVTSGIPLDVPTLREVESRSIDLPAWAGVEQPLYFYEVEGWRPRVYVVRGWRLASGARTIAAQLDALRGAPERVIVDRDPGLTIPTAAGAPDSIGPLVVGAERASVEVDMAAPGLLVVNEAMAPGWTARVDGRPADLLTVNFMMRGVALQSGPHTVEMRYEPPGFRTGLLVTLVALGLVAALLAAGLWAERR